MLNTNDNGDYNHYRILLIEKNPKVRQTIKSCMKYIDPNFLIFETDEGIEAINLIPQIIPDLVILDLVLDYMDGYKILETIKKFSIFKKVPIIVLTNLSGADQVRRAISLGASEYILKPLHVNILRKKINRLLPTMKANHKPFHYNISQSEDIILMQLIGSCSVDEIEQVVNETIQLIESNYNRKLSFIIDMQGVPIKHLTDDVLAYLFNFYHYVDGLELKEMLVYFQESSTMENIKKVMIDQNLSFKDYHKSSIVHIKKDCKKAYIAKS